MTKFKIITNYSSLGDAEMDTTMSSGIKGTTGNANFVFNSIQAVYVADLMTLSLVDAFDRVVVGQSVADISAAAALSFLEGQMFNFYRLKWIAASSDAPLGYKNASIKIQGGVMNVTVEAKLAGLIYFVPITLAISEVTQEAVQ